MGSSPPHVCAYCSTLICETGAGRFSCTWPTNDLSSCRSPAPAKTDQTGCNAVPCTSASLMLGLRMLMQQYYHLQHQKPANALALVYGTINLECPT